MPFLVLGLIVTAIGAYLYRSNQKAGSAYGKNGSLVIIAVGIILTVLFGLVYAGVLLKTPA